MANYNQLNTIGSGPYFPIKLEQSIGSDGKPEYIETVVKHQIITDLDYSTDVDIIANGNFLEEVETLDQEYLKSKYPADTKVGGGLYLNSPSYGVTTINGFFPYNNGDVPQLSLQLGGIKNDGNKWWYESIKSSGGGNIVCSCWNFTPKVDSKYIKIEFELEPQSLFTHMQMRVHRLNEYTYIWDIPLNSNKGVICVKLEKNQTVILFLPEDEGDIRDGTKSVNMVSCKVSYTNESVQGMVSITEETEIKKVPKLGWYILKGDVALIKQNLTAILTYQIGQRFRQEDFGSRTWECLEEPNTSALNLMIKNFVKDGIAAWEPRIKALKVFALKPTKESIRLLIYFKVQNSQKVEELNFQYNLNNLTTDVY
jgi:phage baseplate assembly protein W